MTDERPLYPDNLISQGQLDMFLAREQITGYIPEYTDGVFSERPVTLPKGCPRRWTLHYCAGVAKGTSQALEFGSLGHEALESLTTKQGDWPTHWTGKEPDTPARQRAKASVLAQAMYQHRPPGVFIAEPEYFLDEPFTLQDPDEGGVSYYIKPDGWADRKVFVDWKTTGQDPDSQFVLNADTLKDNIQFNLYALGLMRRWKTRRITGLWVYGNTKFRPGQTPLTWTVSADITLRQAEAFFERVIWPTTRMMIGIKEGIASGDIDSPLLIPHAPNSCNHVGKFCDASAWCGFMPSPITLSSLGLPVIQPTNERKESK